MKPKLTIDLSALVYNYNVLKDNSNKAHCAVVIKNDSYGIGSTRRIVKRLVNCGCTTFFVSYVDEGIKIRDLIDGDIMVLHGPTINNIRDLETHNLTPVINSLIQMELWIKFYPQKPVVIHVDTGLNRIGIKKKDLDFFTPEIIKKINIQFVMSHLACANDINNPLNKIQLNNFKKIIKQFPGIACSLSGSEGIFLEQDCIFDLTRLGSAIYGINTHHNHQQKKMKAILYITATIIQIDQIPAHESVGYYSDYKTKEPRKVAAVSIGYGDGLPRSLGNHNGKIWFEKNNKRYAAPILGNISMDLLVCDITNIPNISIDDVALVLTDYYTIEDMARDANTISREIVARVGRRYEITYKG